MLWMRGPQDSREFILQTGVSIQLSTEPDAKLGGPQDSREFILQTGVSIQLSTEPDAKHMSLRQHTISGIVSHTKFQFI
jgi:hypothetical protein